MKITKIEIKPISQTDQCLLIIHTDVDYRGQPSGANRPEVQQQMPTAVATELKNAWDYRNDE